MKNSGKILHIITSLNDGGAESALTRLCLANPEMYEVISLMDMGKYGSILKNAGIPVYCLNIDQQRPNLFKVFSLYKLIDEINPHVVQTWMYHANLIGGTVAKIARVPKIFWGIRHGNLSKGTIKKSTYITMKICAYLSYLIPTKIISCSNEAVGTHINEGYAESKFVVIQNGYDLVTFKPLLTSVKRLVFTSKPLPVIAMVARYDIQKDHLNLLKAVSILRKKGISFHLVLVGSDIDIHNKGLVDAINQCGLSLNDDMTLYGRSNNIPLIMNSINLHVLSSLGEAFPNVLAEAMACGTPCVSTDVGDAKEIVAEHGWIVDSENSVQLATAIEIALNEFNSQPSIWEKRRMSCIQHIKENFELSDTVKKYHMVWSKL